jgi:acyl dehydratase
MSSAGSRQPESPATEELGSAPSLASLYAKALAGSAIPGRPDALPDRTLALRDVELDLDRLARYARVCGYGIGAAVPPTYPHLLGFPLELELMSARSFPFSVMGVVHVANRIEQLRPVPTDVRPDLRVWAEGLRPHRRGRQFDVVTELDLGGETAWREQSTYLRPGGGDEGSPRSASAGDGEEWPGEIAAVWKVPGDVGRRYGDVSGDRNPIHIHSLAAKAFGFPGAIAHGMWMKARCLAALEARAPDAFEVAVEFRRPLRIPGEARLRVARREHGFDFALESPKGGRAHLTGTIVGTRSESG